MKLGAVGTADQAETHHGIRLQAVLDTAVDGIMLIDAKGSILSFNPACERREVEVLNLVGEALLAIDGQRRSKRIRVVSDVPDQLVIQVDPEKVRRVIVSLLSNAVKFSPNQSIVRLTVGLDQAGLVTITVEDRGIGMDPQAIDRAFAPFVQLDEELSRQFEGSGLGLPLARLLTELHGGRIELDSVPGAGTRVVVTFPAYARASTSRGGG
jgi:signal transduction histidine kinase